MKRDLFGTPPQDAAQPDPLVACISLWNPWAALVACGAKRNETRHWTPRHRGLLAIHAAQRWTRELRELVRTSPFAEALEGQQLQFGGFVALAELVAIVPVEQVRDELDVRERAFGNYADGRFVWQLDNVHPIPFTPARGQQGLWSVRRSQLGGALP